MLTLVLWRHVVFLCVSRTLFRMGLVMVVRRMLCSASLQSHAAQHTTHNHNQAHSKQRTTHTQQIITLARNNICPLRMIV